MGGALLLGLFDDQGGVVKGKRGLAHQIGPVAHDDHGLIGVKAATGLHGMVQQRAARDVMQDLGQVRIHPRAHACGQKYQRNRHTASFLMLAPVLPRGGGAARGGRLTQGDRNENSGL